MTCSNNFSLFQFLIIVLIPHVEMIAQECHFYLISLPYVTVCLVRFEKREISPLTLNVSRSRMFSVMLVLDIVRGNGKRK